MATKGVNKFVDGLDNLALQRYLWEGAENLSASELLVALNLAKHRNRVTLKCCPSQRTIANQTRLSKRTVSRAIRNLEDKSIIRVKRNYEPIEDGDNRERNTNSYIFLFDAGAFLEIMYEGRECPDLDADALELLSGLKL